MTRKDPPTTHALSLTALLVGSLSSAATAVVVHRFWRAGAILGAAATPVLVALFGELLRRPIDRINDHTVRLTGPRPVWVGPSGAGGQMRVYRARPPWQPAIATGLLAFALGVTALTGSELLLDRSVGDPRDRTTLFDPGPGAFTEDGGERPAAEAVTRPQPAPRVARRGPTEPSRAGRRQRPHTVRARAEQVAPLSEPASAGARSGAASPTSPPRRTTTRTTTALPPSTTTTAPPEDPAASTSTVPEDGASSARPAALLPPLRPARRAERRLPPDAGGRRSHTVSWLVGALPGYVGYEEGGQLTEQVRRKPSRSCSSTRSKRRPRTPSTRCLDRHRRVAPA